MSCACLSATSFRSPTLPPISKSSPRVNDGIGKLEPNNAGIVDTSNELSICCNCCKNASGSILNPARSIPKGLILFNAPKRSKSVEEALAKFVRGSANPSKALSVEPTPKHCAKSFTHFGAWYVGRDTLSG